MKTKDRPVWAHPAKDPKPARRAKQPEILPRHTRRELEARRIARTASYAVSAFALAILALTAYLYVTDPLATSNPVTQEQGK